MRPLALVILDGWGYSPQELGNAIKGTATPTFDLLTQNYPALLLQASGRAVGLEWGEPGNSEVGHLTIGAGRTVFQYSPRISRAIETEEFYKNPTLLAAITHAKQNNSALHLVGLMSSGTVHSSIEHLLALINLASRHDLKRVYLHLFTDGKDSGLKEAPKFILKIQEHAAQAGTGTIATLIGRQFAMDRDNNWGYTEQTYNLFVKGAGQAVSDVFAALETYYSQGLDDSRIPPTVLDQNGMVRSGDAVILFNFREDSMRQIARAFVEPQFQSFDRTLLEDLQVAFMTRYLDAPDLNLNVAFSPPEIPNNLPQTFSALGANQLHIAETEKYAHVTYFFNCLRDAPYERETDILIKSEGDHERHPELKVADIARRFAEEFGKGTYQFAIMNFANVDVLSHSGDLELTKKGVQHVDAALNVVYNAVLQQDGILVVTADHGNAESLTYAGGEAETKHNLNPVPFVLVAREYQRPRTPEELVRSFEDSRGLLSDVAPTILELMQIPIPSEMTGTSLVPLVQ